MGLVIFDSCSRCPPSETTYGMDVTSEMATVGPQYVSRVDKRHVGDSVPLGGILSLQC